MAENGAFSKAKKRHFWVTEPRFLNTSDWLISPYVNRLDCRPSSKKWRAPFSDEGFVDVTQDDYEEENNRRPMFPIGSFEDRTINRSARLKVARRTQRFLRRLHVGAEGCRLGSCLRLTESSPQNPCFLSSELFVTLSSAVNVTPMRGGKAGKQTRVFFTVTLVEQLECKKNHFDTLRRVCLLSERGGGWKDADRVRSARWEDSARSADTLAKGP